MQFELSHEFDAPLDTVELAIMSPDLATRIAEHWQAIESVKTVEHDLDTHDVGEGEFRRVWEYQAKGPLHILKGYDVTRDMLSWHEHATHSLSDHTGEFYVTPCDPSVGWGDYFSASGQTRLEEIDGGGCRRTIFGALNIHIKFVARLVERVALSEIRRAYQAEAQALRSLCSLA